MSFAEKCFKVFTRCVEDFHSRGGVETEFFNPYEKDGFEYYLYQKAWIDSRQWHLEDQIREEGIDAQTALGLKRQIDGLNQERTDAVERLDDYFVEEFRGVKPLADARLNTESLAWALDRLSILALKIYHMRQEVERESVALTHRERCREKLFVLNGQREDLLLAITQLREDILAGRRYMKVYRQMKMYNDPELNPVLYGQKK